MSADREPTFFGRTWAQLTDVEREVITEWDRLAFADGTLQKGAPRVTLTESVGPVVPAAPVDVVVPVEPGISRVSLCGYAMSDPRYISPGRFRRLAIAKGKKPRKRPGAGYGPGKVAAAFMLADPCAYCGGPADTWDHIESRKRGGDHSAGNLARVCFPCNAEKSSRLLLLFLVLRAQRKAAGIWRRLPASRLREGP